MDNFVRNLITEWRRLGLPFENETLVVAVSGGADSVSLILALNDLKTREKLHVRLVAAHFDHRLRGPDSERDRDFVRQLAEDLGVELAFGAAETMGKGNLEQNARNARYEFLAETAAGVGSKYVLTGHTLNDQAETFLINLIRGSGPQGLAGMRTVRPLGPAETGLVLVRPLLTWAKRRDTENYCRFRGVEFRYDSMNEDLAFTRVRVRKLLLPMLEEFNPKIIETLANTASLMGRGPEAQTNGRSESTGDDADGLLLKELKSLSQPDLYARLRSWLSGARNGLRGLELKHISGIERLINSRKSGKTIELPGGGRVIKRGGKLVFEKIKVEK
jgi:tRNA(Ile)-lysidine synthase